MHKDELYEIKNEAYMCNYKGFSQKVYYKQHEKYFWQGDQCKASGKFRYNEDSQYRLAYEKFKPVDW